MASHRLPSRPPLPWPARLALPVVNVGLTATAVVACWVSGGTGPVGSASAPEYAGTPASSGRQHVEQVLDAHDCSVTGFDDGEVPGSAVVRTAAGRLRHVSFDTGWRIYTEHGAAQLVAVCHDRPPVT